VIDGVESPQVITSHQGYGHNNNGHNGQGQQDWTCDLVLFGFLMFVRHDVWRCNVMCDVGASKVTPAHAKNNAAI
jgi:hypothetical protein